MNMYLQTQFQWRKPPRPQPGVQTSPALQAPPQLPAEPVPAPECPETEAGTGACAVLTLRKRFEQAKLRESRSRHGFSSAASIGVTV